MYLVVIFGQIHTLHTLHTLHKGRGFWRVENSYPLPLPLPLPSKSHRGLGYSCHSLIMLLIYVGLAWYTTMITYDHSTSKWSLQ